MYYESTRTTATKERLITRIVLAGIALAFVTLIAVIMAQDTNAANMRTDYQDGALMEASAPDQFPVVNVTLRDAAQIQFEEDNWLLIDPAAPATSQYYTRSQDLIQFHEDNWLLIEPAIGDLGERVILDSASTRFIEENVQLPVGSSTSNLAQVDSADHIGALRSDTLDVSLGLEAYVTEKAPAQMSAPYWMP